MKASRPHIVLNEAGTPVIVGTWVKVSHLILDHLVFGWTPGEIKLNHSELSLEQIHAALAYYYEHQIELDQTIYRELARIERFQAQQNKPPRLAQIVAQRRIS